MNGLVIVIESHQVYGVGLGLHMHIQVLDTLARH